LTSGSLAELTISVRPNIELRDLEISLSPGPNLVFPQSVFRVEPSGGRVKLNAYVPIDAVGNAVLNYVVFYTTTSGFRGEYAGSLYLITLKKPDVELSVSIVPQNPEVGKPFYLVVKLYNRGGTKAVSAEVKLNTTLKVVKSPGPLGVIPPQSSKDATFTLTAEETGLYNLTVIAKYGDELGRTFLKEKQISIYINKTIFKINKIIKSNQINIYIIMIILIVAIALIALGVKKRHVVRSA